MIPNACRECAYHRYTYGSEGKCMVNNKRVKSNEKNRDCPLRPHNHIKDCPFCGGEPVIYKGTPPGTVTIKCKKCGVSGLPDDRTTAIAIWNERVNK